MYVDESGDAGLTGSQTPVFILTGLVVHELRWRQTLEAIIAFRKAMRTEYKLPFRAELHASHLINKPGDLVSIKRYHRLAILRRFADLLAGLPDLNLINVVVKKAGKDPAYNVFESAWGRLIQRFENTISHRNFPGPINQDERGLIFPDHTDTKRVVRLIRKMRRYNPIPSRPQFATDYRDIPIGSVIEDPSFRDSKDSFFIQAADLCAYLLYQKLHPNAYMKSKGGQNYFDRLDLILCKAASKTNAQGIVYI